MAGYNSIERAGNVEHLPMLADAVIEPGELTAVTAAGFARKAGDVAGLRVVGRAEQANDNTDGANGDKSLDVRRGMFSYDNSGTNDLAQGDYGAVCYVEDERTVGDDPGDNAVIAGIFKGFVDGDATKVWVDTTHNAALAAAAADAAAQIAAI